MKISDVEWIMENKRLQEVLKEALKQLDENRELKEKSKNDYIETQREMWQDVGSVSITNGLDQIVDFMQFIDTMKIQKRSHEVGRKLEEKYERILLSPYFGRMDFLENGEVKAEKCYIGVANLINDNFEFLVYDWRSPISSMFYDYEMGDANYECPEGIINGNISLKRQYKISNGKIQYMFDSNIKIDDEVLQDILGKNTDNKMKAIVTTIQREQNRVIRNEEYRNLIVQGPAGSGKTSVALHRIAYLLYKHREKIKPQNIVIFSPNNIFNDYISNVLPQLGEDNMYQTTFKEYMHGVLGNELKNESYCQMMEYILSDKGESGYNNRINNIKFKSSVKFIDLLKKYVINLEEKHINIPDVIIRDKVIVSSSQIKELSKKEYAHLSLKTKLQKIKDRILLLVESYKDELIEEMARELEKSNSCMDKAEITAISTDTISKKIKDVHDNIIKITEFNLIETYKNFLSQLSLSYTNLDDKNCDTKIKEIINYTLKNLASRILNYEDQIALLYLKTTIGDFPKTSEIKYVIIDEAQDYSPIQYEIFNLIFKDANMTILGDLNQSINPYMNAGNYENISHIFPKESTSIINLTKSYRSTMEITKFSRKLLRKVIADEYVERNGDAPLLLGFPDRDTIKVRLIDDIEKYAEKGYKSVGIITRTGKEAKEVYSFLQEKVKVNAILTDEDEYVSGNLVIPGYLAKGLEFDVVLIYDAGDENYGCEDERLLLYTACTRALHILCIYYSGEITPLLKVSVFE